MANPSSTRGSQTRATWRRRHGMRARTPPESNERWLARLLGADFLLWSPTIQAEGFLRWDRIFATRPIPRGKRVSDFKRAARELDVRFQDQGRTCDTNDLMRDEHLSGLLVLKRGEILLERYALGLNPELRSPCSSMVSSLASSLIGAALHDRLIGSLDDAMTKYLPDFAGTAYDGVTV